MQAPPDAGGGGGGHLGHVPGVPSEAPALVWTVVITAVTLWWLWPWLARLRGDATQSSLYASRHDVGMRLPHAPLASAGAGQEGAGGAACPAAPEEPDIAEAGAGRLDAELPFDLVTEFNQTFTGSADLLRSALHGPPTGPAYTAALTAINKLSEILDRLFLAFGNAEELTKVSCLREGSETFKRDYGHHQLGEHMRGLLQNAGFERREHGDNGAVWVFPHEDALARLRGLTTRLCLQRSAALQKARGPGRFLHENNDAVIPKLQESCFADLVDLYKGKGALSASETKCSFRERALEGDVRLKLNQRRVEKGLEAFNLHEGLAVIARNLADAQRTRARKDSDDLYPTRQIANEVRAALARMPLPPGFTVAHLHWSSTELPRLFGLTSTRGSPKDADPNFNKKEEEGDTAAEIMANEAVGFWAARQQADVLWPAAAICGVGAALDYTVNKGFVVALLVGFEKQGGEDEVIDLASGSSSGLRRRAPPKKEAKPERAPIEAPKFTPAGSHRPRITGFRDLGKPKAGG